MADHAMTPEQARAHWAKTSTLMWTMLAIWFVFSFVIHFFVTQLNTITFIAGFARVIPRHASSESTFGRSGPATSCPALS